MKSVFGAIISFVNENLKKNRYFNFNLVHRDEWIKKQAISVPSQSLLLDIGAGSSPYRKYFSHCIYNTQDFCQLEPEQLRFGKGYSQIDIVSEAHHIPVSDSSYDVVLITEALEHVPNPIEVIAEISRILKPGGKLILTAPLGSGLHQQPYHFYGGYTPFWYEKYLSLFGFNQLSIEPNGNFFKFFGQEAQRFIQISFPTKLSANIFFKILWFPFWLCILPLWFLIPLVCSMLDKYDRSKIFTVGYHVTAKKIFS